MSLLDPHVEATLHCSWLTGDVFLFNSTSWIGPRHFYPGPRTAVQDYYPKMQIKVQVHLVIQTPQLQIFAYFPGF